VCTYARNRDRYRDRYLPNEENGARRRKRLVGDFLVKMSDRDEDRGSIVSKDGEIISLLLSNCLSLLLWGRKMGRIILPDLFPRCDMFMSCSDIVALLDVQDGEIRIIR
jgi:hypothetical protein